MEPTESQFETTRFKKINLVADPIHGYIQLTWPRVDSGAVECTEKDIVDTPWLQRLRRIHQLQAVWWVFPGGEHTRFQHSLGTMHLAGLFASHLYDSLNEKASIGKSRYYVEEIMRLAGLLHDVGHGPFCHFFDEEYLEKKFQDEDGNPINHEILGQKIIREKLRHMIEKITRSPGGSFEQTDGQINVDWLCYLIRKDQEPREEIPLWLRVLKGLMTGVYTVDNLDYVWRDAYMCGILPKPIDVERLRYYTFTTKEGLALYLPAITALEEFLRFRCHMYFSVYYHRTVRAIELHMREIFGETIELLYDKVNPYKNLDHFLSMDDWSLLCGVQNWLRAGTKRQKAVAKEWKLILERNPKWRFIRQYSKDFRDIDAVLEIPLSNVWEERVKKKLGPKGTKLRFRVDLPQEDPRRLDPLYDIKDPSQVKIYDPAMGRIDLDESKRLAERLPAKSVVFRLYVPRDQSRQHDQALVSAFDSVMRQGYGRGERLSTST